MIPFTSTHQTALLQRLITALEHDHRNLFGDRHANHAERAVTCETCRAIVDAQATLKDCDTLLTPADALQRARDVFSPWFVEWARNRLPRGAGQRFNDALTAAFQPAPVTGERTMPKRWNYVEMMKHLNASPEVIALAEERAREMDLEPAPAAPAGITPTPEWPLSPHCDRAVSPTGKHGPVNKDGRCRWCGFKVPTEPAEPVPAPVTTPTVDQLLEECRTKDRALAEYRTEVAALEASLRDKERELAEARKEIETDNALLKHRDELLAAIPECPQHGPCMPHALEWIQTMRYDATRIERDTLAKAREAVATVQFGPCATTCHCQGDHWNYARAQALQALDRLTPERR